MIRDATAQSARLAAARALVDDILIPAEARMDAEDRMPEAARAALRAHGLFGLSIPEAHGGLGLTMEEEAGLMLVLGRTAPAYRAVYALNSGGAAQILLRAGTEAQKARWLRSWTTSCRATRSSACRRPSPRPSRTARCYWPKPAPAPARPTPISCRRPAGSR